MYLFDTYVVYGCGLFDLTDDAASVVFGKAGRVANTEAVGT